MQHDEVIWQILRHNHCSFMSKIETRNFCRNPYNVTGICNQSSCPLANSRYATVREEAGVFYLYMKTIERAHMPNRTWERVKLPRNFPKALEIIDKHLAYWPALLVHKAKQRLTKLTQMRIRMRKLALKTREKIVTVPTKEKRREARREKRAEIAACLENSIEKEVIERLNAGIYKDVYKVKIPQVIINEFDVEEEEYEPEVVEYVEDGDNEDEDDMEDFEDFAGLRYDDDDDVDDDDEGRVEKDKGPFKSKKKVKVEVEIERDGTERQTGVY